MQLVIAEKPSVGRSVASVIGATEKKDGYLEGNGYIVTWCIGHLVQLASPDKYDSKYGTKISEWKFWKEKREACQPLSGHDERPLFLFAGISFIINRRI